MNYLENKTAIITGASSGIGKAAAKALAENGVKIVAAARNQERLDALVAEIRAAGGRASGRVVDVTNLTGLGRIRQGNLRNRRHPHQQRRSNAVLLLERSGDR